MRYSALMILVSLAGFAMPCAAASLCLALTWRQVAARLERLAPAPRARLLLVLRAGPAAVGMLSTAVAATAFVLFEPRATAEVPGWTLLAAAGCGGTFLGASVLKTVSAWRATSTFLRAVEATAVPVTIPGADLPARQLDIAFPLVALGGLWRPRLLIARCVLEQVPRDELDVIVRHELAHARRRDNVLRMMVAGMPDVPLLWRWAGIDRAWSMAAEEAADDLATHGDASRRASLASALVRVATMARSSAPLNLPLLAFHDGASVERRVRRLLAPTPAPSRVLLPALRASALWLLFGVLPLLAVIAAVLPEVHDAIEWLVNARP